MKNAGCRNQTCPSRLGEDVAGKDRPGPIARAARRSRTWLIANLSPRRSRLDSSSASLASRVRRNLRRNRRGAWPLEADGRPLCPECLRPARRSQSDAGCGESDRRRLDPGSARHSRPCRASKTPSLGYFCPSISAVLRVCGRAARFPMWLLDREDRQQVRHLGQVHETAIACPCRPAATPRNGKWVLGV